MHFLQNRIQLVVHEKANRIRTKGGMQRKGRWKGGMKDKEGRQRKGERKSLMIDVTEMELWNVLILESFLKILHHDSIHNSPHSHLLYAE